MTVDVSPRPATPHHPVLPAAPKLLLCRAFGDVCSAPRGGAPDAPWLDCRNIDAASERSAAAAARIPCATPGRLLGTALEPRLLAAPQKAFTASA